MNGGRLSDLAVRARRALGPRSLAASSGARARAAAGELGSVGAATWAVLALLTGLFALLNFPGLEATLPYSGSAWQVIFPGSYPGDPYLDPRRPVLRSLFYVVIGWLGPACLDDRVLLVGYAAMAGIAVLALFDCARSLGLREPAAALAAVSPTVTDHLLLDYMSLPLTRWDFSPTVPAMALSLVVLAQLLRRASAGWMLATTGLLVLVSVKNAWMPALLVAGALVARRSPRERRVAAAVAVAAGAVGLALAALAAPPDAATLWETLLAREGGETNPLLPHNTLLGGGIWAGGCLATLAVPARDASAREALGVARLVAGVSLAVCVLAALYFSFAPPALRVPQAVPFAPTRALWLSQHVAMMAVLAAGLGAAERRGGWPALVALVTGYALLTAVPGVATSRLLWTGLPLVGATLGTALALARSGSGSAAPEATWDPRPLSVAAVATGVSAAAAFGEDPRAQSLGLMVVVLAAAGLTRLAGARVGPAPAPLLAVGGVLSTAVYLGGMVSIQGPALAELARTGVLGSNATATWVGTDAWIAAHTPPEVVVLALRRCDGPYRDDTDPRTAVCPEDRLVADGSLRTRTGRASPVPVFYAGLFDASHHARVARQWEVLDALGAAWLRHDGEGVRRARAALVVQPDILVVPRDEASWAAELAAPLAEVGDHAVLAWRAPGG